MCSYSSAVVMLLFLAAANLPAHARPNWPPGGEEMEDGQDDLAMDHKSRPEETQPEEMEDGHDDLAIPEGTKKISRTIRQIFTPQSSVFTSFETHLHQPSLNPGFPPGQHHLGSQLTPFSVGSNLASTVDHIVNTHLESTVQHNQALHDRLQSDICPTCGHFVNPTPNFNEHHVHIGQPVVTVVKETHSVTHTCSGYDCMNGHGDILRPNIPSSPVNVPDDISRPNIPTFPENVPDEHKTFTHFTLPSPISENENMKEQNFHHHEIPKYTTPNYATYSSKSNVHTETTPSYIPHEDIVFNNDREQKKEQNTNSESDIDIRFGN